MFFKGILCQRENGGGERALSSDLPLRPCWQVTQPPQDPGFSPLNEG